MSQWSQSLSQISQGLMFAGGHFVTPEALPADPSAAAGKEDTMNLFKSPMFLSPEIPHEEPGTHLGPTYGNRVVAEEWFGPAPGESDPRRERAAASRLRVAEYRRRDAGALDQG